LRPPEAELERRVRTLQAERRLPSVSAAVYVDGDVVWELAVGLADAATGREATPDTQYRIGSITKTFTAAAVLRLAGEGALDLLAPLREYVPELADDRVRVKDVLSHASGLQREEPGASWDDMSFLSRDELIARLDEVGRVLEPRDEWHYSNIGFTLLGDVVGRITGDYERTIQDWFFGPAGLTRTTWQPDAGAAVGYHPEPWTDVLHVERNIDLNAGRPAGQLWSTTADLARWAGFLRRDEALAPMQRLQTIADHTAWTYGSGLGLLMWRSGERIFAGHSGGMNGFLANLAWDVGGRTGAVIFTNSSPSLSIDAEGIGLASQAAELMAPMPEPWRPGDAPPPELDGVLGNWWTEGWEFVLTYREGSLRAAAVGSTRAPAVFEPAGPDRYRTVSGRERGELLEIQRDADGRPNRLSWATYAMTRTSLPMAPG
jgi:CubicO group peptidase (beta-lactamase class C family)